MGGKAPKKHTKKELDKKAKESNTNKGGGKAGKQDREGGKAGHAKFLCPYCKQPTPDLKTMKIHHESKHDKIPFDENNYEDQHKLVGGTTTGVAIRGSTKRNKK